MTINVATTTTVINDCNHERLRAAMSRMPYAATDRVPTPWASTGERVDVDDVVAFLDGLASVLIEVFEENDVHRRRLHSLEAGLEAFRSLIGTEPAETNPWHSNIEWFAARETSVEMFNPGDHWVGSGEHHDPVLTLAGDDVVAIKGTPAELRTLAERITAVAAAASAPLDLTAEAG